MLSVTEIMLPYLDFKENKDHQYNFNFNEH